MDSEAVGIRGIFPARFPKLKFLAGWPAYPWQDEMIAILVHKGNVHYELHSGRRRPSRRARRARKRGPETAVRFRFREERFERELIRTRTGEGRQRAKARGVILGRKPKLTSHQRREAIARPERC
jgi:hypothetical protein